MRSQRARIALALATAVTLLSCTDTTGVDRTLRPGSARHTVTNSAGALVISQVYGAGGNSGSTFKNDFIEIYNPGAQAVDVTGWSVQYTSAAGTTWQVTNLAGSVQPGAYYLIQESAGAGGTTSLPTPDATGGIAMSGTDGKVALVQSTTALSGACPTATASAIDLVSYGSGNCGTAASVLTVTTADFRNDGGCAYTGSPAVDFTRATAAPRNSASPTHTCGGGQQTVDHITVAGATTILAGSSTQLTATAFDATNAPLSPQPAFGWSTSDASIVDVNVSTGSASGVAVGNATITASAGGKSGTISITVNQPANVVGKVVISQVYGGGGNSGATLKNDFIELFNPGGASPSRSRDGACSTPPPRERRGRSPR